MAEWTAITIYARAGEIECFPIARELCSYIGIVTLVLRPPQDAASPASATVEKKRIHPGLRPGAAGSGHSVFAVP